MTTLTQPRTARSSRLTKAFYAAVVITYAVFAVSTIPGVRPEAGYNLFLDGWLNNIAYMLSAVL